MSVTSPTHREEQFVDESESLWRGIHKFQIKPNSDGTYRPSSGAFKSTDPSVDIASKTTPEKSIRNFAALSGFLAEVPIKLGYPVIEDPEEGNDAHAFIKGNIKKGDAKKIANASEWVVSPKLVTGN
jgi:hypothetical protein